MRVLLWYARSGCCSSCCPARAKQPHVRWRLQLLDRTPESKSAACQLLRLQLHTPACNCILQTPTAPAAACLDGVGLDQLARVLQRVFWDVVHRLACTLSPRSLVQPAAGTSVSFSAGVASSLAATTQRSCIHASGTEGCRCPVQAAGQGEGCARWCMQLHSGTPQAHLQAGAGTRGQRRGCPRGTRRPAEQ